MKSYIQHYKPWWGMYITVETENRDSIVQLDIDTGNAEYGCVALINVLGNNDEKARFLMTELEKEAKKWSIKHLYVRSTELEPLPNELSRNSSDNLMFKPEWLESLGYKKCEPAKYNCWNNYDMVKDI